MTNDEKDEEVFTIHHTIPPLKHLEGKKMTMKQFNVEIAKYEASRTNKSGKAEA